MTYNKAMVERKWKRWKQQEEAKPSMETYERIMETLGAEVRLKDDETSLNGKCLAKIRESILEKTEAQALFIIGIVEYVSEYIDHISK